MEEKCNAPRTDSVSAERNNLSFHLCRRRSLPPNRAIKEAGGSVHKHIRLARRTNFPPNETAARRNDDYIRLTSESNQSVMRSTRGLGHSPPDKFTDFTPSTALRVGL